jgi:hypothetical protein
MRTFQVINAVGDTRQLYQTPHEQEHEIARDSNSMDYYTAKEDGFWLAPDGSLWWERECN